MKGGEIKLAELKNNQNNFKSDLGEIKKGSTKSKEQKDTTYNIELLYKARKEAINFFDDHSLMVSEAKTKAKNKTSGKWLKILTSNQILQGLSIAFAQVHAGNNSENLLNKIRQIAYSLYQSKKWLKKYAIR